MSDWLYNIPLYWGKVIAVVAFAGMVAWAWRRPRSFIYEGAPDSHRWRDLRIWASALMAIQIVLYLTF